MLQQPTTNTPIDGDLTIARDLTAGGRLIIRDDARFARTLTVEGWLRARNIRGASMGLYLTLDKLQAAHPRPLPGDWALVLTGDKASDGHLPADIYITIDGKWTAAGRDATLLDVEIAELPALRQDLQSETDQRKQADLDLQQEITQGDNKLQDQITRRATSLTYDPGQQQLTLHGQQPDGTDTTLATAILQGLATSAQLQALHTRRTLADLDQLTDPHTSTGISAVIYGTKVETGYLTGYCLTFTDNMRHAITQTLLSNYLILPTTAATANAAASPAAATSAGPTSGPNISAAHNHRPNIYYRLYALSDAAPLTVHDLAGNPIEDVQPHQWSQWHPYHQGLTTPTTPDGSTITWE